MLVETLACYCHDEGGETEVNQPCRLLYRKHSTVFVIRNTKSRTDKAMVLRSSGDGENNSTGTTEVGPAGINIFCHLTCSSI